MQFSTTYLLSAERDRHHARALAAAFRPADGGHVFFGVGLDR